MTKIILTMACIWLAVFLFFALSCSEVHATTIKSIEHLPKYDCKTTSKPVLKKAIKKRIAQIKEERIVLIKPTCPIVDDEQARKKVIGYGAERDLVRDTVWNSVTRQPDNYTFNSGFIPFIGGSYYLVTNPVRDIRYVHIPHPTPPSSVPIPNALVLFCSVVFLMLRRK